MCNIAGYIGKKAAAPILCEMMKKQEGFGAGYYTGITTHDGMSMHTVKVLGDMQNLLNETKAISFPGTMGFLHSRSKSGGGVEWGQPFLAKDGDVSYIANGAAGVFLTEEMKEKRCALALELEAKGYNFLSRCEGVIGDYPALADGTAIHMSDLMCQYIACLMDEGLSPTAAMSKANSEFPSEVVGLVIRKENPRSIFVTRINYPMTIGITTDGDTYLATTPLAFPEDVEFKLIELLPPATTYEVYEGGFRAATEPVEINNIASITPDIWHEAYVRTEKFLLEKGEPATVLEALEPCKDIWPAGKVGQIEPLIYGVMYGLHKEGRLGVAYVEEDGAFDGYKMNKFKIYLKH